MFALQVLKVFNVRLISDFFFILDRFIKLRYILLRLDGNEYTFQKTPTFSYAHERW